MKILDSRAAFKFQVGQLVVQDAECSWEPKKKYW